MIHMTVTSAYKKGFTRTPILASLRRVFSKNTMPNLVSGFTLIELLVVISIIGVLSSVVLASLNSARTKARDASRTSSIRQVQLAIEMYYDANGKYPYPLPPWPTPPNNSDVPLNWPSIVTDLAPYISKIPVDPTNPFNYHYYVATLNPAPYYAIYIPYETKTPCYVCGGSICQSGLGYWAVNICQ